MAARARDHFPGISATASDSYSSNTPDRAVDGNLATRWETRAAGDQWFDVDFGRGFRTAAVEVHHQSHRIAGYELYVSDEAEPEDWGDPVATGELPNNDGYHAITFAPVEVRRMRLVVTSRHSTRIYLYDVRMPTYMRKIPQGQMRATASSFYSDYEPANVISGNLSRWETREEGDQWIQLDMGERVWLEAIELYNASHRIRGYDVYLSHEEDPVDWGDPVATGELPDSVGYHLIECGPAIGRHVRLVVTSRWSTASPPRVYLNDWRVYTTPFALADTQTGGQFFTSGTQPDVASLPLLLNYDRYQITESDSMPEEDWEVFDPQDPPSGLSVSLPEPSGDTLHTRYVWFKDSTAADPWDALVFPGHIVTTTVVPTAVPRDRTLRARPDASVDVTGMAVDGGSDGGTVLGIPIDIVQRPVACNEDESEADPDVVTLSAREAPYTVALSVVNEAGAESAPVDATVTIETLGEGPHTMTWVGPNDESDADGRFNDAGNWDTGAIPGPLDTVVIPEITSVGTSGDGTRTITVDLAVDIAELRMEQSDDPYWSRLLVTADMGIERIRDTGAIRGELFVEDGVTVTVHDADSYDRGPWIYGVGDIVTTGDADLRLDRANNFLGTITANSGDLFVRAWHRDPGYAKHTQRITINAGARLWGTAHLRRHIQFGQELHLNGGMLDMWDIDSEHRQHMTLTDDTTIVLVADSMSTLYINWRGYTHSLYIRIESHITGAGGLVKTGPDEVELLSISSDYSGPTTVEEGTLKVLGILHNSHVTVKDGAVLWGAVASFPAGVTVEEGGEWIVPFMMWSGDDDPNNSGDWSDPDNWFGGTLPASTDSVLLPIVDGQGNNASDERVITVDTPVTVGSIFMGLTLDPHWSTLLVNDDLTVESFEPSSRATVVAAEGTTLTVGDYPANGPFLQGGGDIVSTGFCVARRHSDYNPTGTWTVAAGTLGVEQAHTIGGLRDLQRVTAQSGTLVRNIRQTSNRHRVTMGQELHLYEATLRLAEHPSLRLDTPEIFVGADSTIEVDLGGSPGDLNEISSVLIGGADLMFVGPDRLRLTGESPDYSGTLRVTNAVAELRGRLGGDVILEEGGTLAGDGTVDGSVLAGADSTVTPGIVTGTLNAGQLVLEADSTVIWRLRDAAAAPGEGWGFLDVTQDLSLPDSGTVTFRVVTVDAEGAPGPAAGFDPLENYAWPIARTGSVSGDVATRIAVETSGFAGFTGHPVTVGLIREGDYLVLKHQHPPRGTVFMLR